MRAEISRRQVGGSGASRQKFEFLGLPLLECALCKRLPIVMATKRLILAIFVNALLLASVEWRGRTREGAADVAPFASATLLDHKNLVYTLPRPGVRQDEDCYSDNYADDLRRDLALMSDLAVTTVMTWNGWDFGGSHGAFLDTLAKYNMSLGITFKPDLNGVMRKNLEKLSKLLTQYSVTLEFLYLDYPLDFDNAEDFFRWVIQVRGWMYQLSNLNAPLFVRFFPTVSNPKTVQVLLQQWDAGAFDAWVVEAYSPTSMVSWLVDRMQDNTKKLFFIYGADTWTMKNSTTDEESQAPQLESLVDLIQLGTYDPATNHSASPTAPVEHTAPTESTPTATRYTKGARPSRYRYTADYADAQAPTEPSATTPVETPVDSSTPTEPAAPAPGTNITARLMSGAIQGFADAWFLGSDSNYFQGGALDVCPDKNPYLHTSCGGTDLNIQYGDKYYSVEHLGLFRQYETIYYFRCIDPTPASLMLQHKWNPNAKKAIVTTCTLSVSIPGAFVLYIWAAGFVTAVAALIASCCHK